ncbi:hypothetical protein LS215_3000 [Sulfolobus islandicus L.S.2.15]|uniref:Uncharacterized protein n=1 Tax=Saccharolobus islandicus (strain L.S.2.15 / Lassen \|nr:hypothetical protein LS215_3000 [Sulfolobus islandicus L.S.2.15]
MRYFKRRIGNGRVYMVMDNYSPHKTKGALEEGYLSHIYSSLFA